MAQETVSQGQGVQTTVKITRPFRNTGMGGVDVTYVLTPEGEFIRPSHRVRSRSGNHGWDEWVLGADTYVIITISRPNLKNGARPFEVSIQCIEVTAGKALVKAEKKFFIMDWDLNSVREWAKAICP